MGQKTITATENHELQRKAAEEFKSKWPATESINFTHEGKVSGAGSWGASAIVTMGGKEYQQLVGLGVGGGDPLPEPGSLPPSGAMTVGYSDGTSEVLR